MDLDIKHGSLTSQHQQDNSHEDPVCFVESCHHTLCCTVPDMLLGLQFFHTRCLMALNCTCMSWTNLEAMSNRTGPWDSGHMFFPVSMVTQPCHSTSPKIGCDMLLN